jgi:hypothetical protein
MKNQEKLGDLVNNLERERQGGGGVKSKGIKEGKPNPKKSTLQRKEAKLYGQKNGIRELLNGSKPEVNAK